MNKSILKKALKDVKYYYSRKDFFENSFKTMGVCKIKYVAEYLKKIVITAPIKLNEMYYCIYVENNTYESIAFKMGYTYNYILKLNKRLLDYLLKEINKKENEDAEIIKMFG